MARAVSKSGALVVCQSCQRSTPVVLKFLLSSVSFVFRLRELKPERLFSQSVRMPSVILQVTARRCRRVNGVPALSFIAVSGICVNLMHAGAILMFVLKQTGKKKKRKKRVHFPVISLLKSSTISDVIIFFIVDEIKSD